jgi:hypothetical protein
MPTQVKQQLTAQGGGGAGRSRRRGKRGAGKWQPAQQAKQSLQEKTITDPVSGKPIEVVVGPQRAVNAFIRSQIRNKESIAAYGFTPMLAKNDRLVAVAYMKGFPNFIGSLEPATFNALYAAAKSLGLNQEFNWFCIETTMDGTVQVTSYTGQLVDDETMHDVSSGFAWAVFTKEGLVAGAKGDQTRTLLLIAPSGTRHDFATVRGTKRYGHLEDMTDEETRQSVVAGALVQAKIGGTHLYGVSAAQIRAYLAPGGGKLAWAKSQEFPGIIEDINLLDTTIQGNKSFVSCNVSGKTELVPLNVSFKDDENGSKAVHFSHEKKTIASPIGAWVRTMPSARKVISTKGNGQGRHVLLTSFDDLSSEMKKAAESYQPSASAPQAAA